MNYRKAFFGILVLAVGLASGLIYLLRQNRSEQTQPAHASAVQPAPAALPAEQAQQQPDSPNLSPVQLSPERLQSIGVKFAVVKRQPVQDEIRVTGNVDV